MEDAHAQLSPTNYAASLYALGVATCCILPITLLLLGVGGGWLAIFAKLAAASYYVLAASTALIVASAWVSYWRGSIRRLKYGLGASAAMTLIAWVIVLNEARINVFLIMRM